MAAPERRAAIRLAVLMGRTPGELAESITALEFAEIMTVMPELAAQHPAMMGAGIVAAVLSNVNRGKDAPARVPADFLPDPWTPRVPQEGSAADFVAALNPTRPEPGRG